jgi:Zn-dependent M28 family amino/carboxypeptidase
MLQGWLEGEASRDLFRRAGLDLDKLRAEARSPSFRPVTLAGATFSADVPVTAEQVQSYNVLGKIRGAKRPDEIIMYGAHWDAYGVGTPDAQGRTIRPGAADDAIGIAGMVEIARAFAAGPKPDRTVVFAAWTGEERGLLGSETYAVHPLFPLEKTVANLTMDILQTGGPARDVVLVGPGQSSLEDDLARAAQAQGRTITPETLPERGLFYRADHFSVARRGVPTLLLMGIAGPHNLVEGGTAAGQKWLDAYMACYHQTCDTWSPALNFSGAAQDVALLYAIGRDLAFSSRWPEWRPSSEFRAIRDRSAAQRK